MILHEANAIGVSPNYICSSGAGQVDRSGDDELQTLLAKSYSPSLHSPSPHHTITAGILHWFILTASCSLDCDEPYLLPAMWQVALSFDSFTLLIFLLFLKVAEKHFLVFSSLAPNKQGHCHVIVVTPT